MSKIKFVLRDLVIYIIAASIPSVVYGLYWTYTSVSRYGIVAGVVNEAIEGILIHIFLLIPTSFVFLPLIYLFSLVEKTVCQKKSIIILAIIANILPNKYLPTLGGDFISFLFGDYLLAFMLGQTAMIYALLIVIYIVARRSLMMLMNRKT